MIHRLRIVVVLLSLCYFPIGQGAPVWKIEHEGSVLYLAGTIHILGNDDYPLPNAFESAYRASDTVVFETDVGELKSPAANQKLMQSVSYASGASLSQDLSPEVYAAVELFFSDRGIQMSQMAGFKPGMLSLVMIGVELGRLGLADAGAGVEEYFDARARTDGKNLGGLESVDQQIAYLADLGAGQEDALIRATLRDIEQLPLMWQSLKHAWREGDLDRLYQIGGEPLRSDFPTIYRQMLVDRNKAWVPQLERMLRNDAVEMVLVGALHLTGPGGLLDQLAQRGYRAQRI